MPIVLAAVPNCSLSVPSMLLPVKRELELARLGALKLGSHRLGSA